METRFVLTNDGNGDPTLWVVVDDNWTVLVRHFEVDQLVWNLVISGLHFRGKAIEYQGHTFIPRETSDMCTACSRGKHQESHS